MVYFDFGTCDGLDGSVTRQAVHFDFGKMDSDPAGCRQFRDETDRGLKRVREAWRRPKELKTGREAWRRPREVEEVERGLEDTERV